MRNLRMSGALRYAMHLNRTALALEKGKEPQGKCVDCKREIPPSELCVKCEHCKDDDGRANLVCVNCVDKHDDKHQFEKAQKERNQMLVGAGPARRGRFN